MEGLRAPRISPARSGNRTHPPHDPVYGVLGGESGIVRSGYCSRMVVGHAVVGDAGLGHAVVLGSCRVLLGLVLGSSRVLLGVELHVSCCCSGPHSGGILDLDRVSLRRCR